MGQRWRSLVFLRRDVNLHAGGISPRMNGSIAGIRGKGYLVG